MKINNIFRSQYSLLGLTIFIISLFYLGELLVIGKYTLLENEAHFALKSLTHFNSYLDYTFISQYIAKFLYQIYPTELILRYLAILFSLCTLLSILYWYKQCFKFDPIINYFTLVFVYISVILLHLITLVNFQYSIFIFFTVLFFIFLYKSLHQNKLTYWLWSIVFMYLAIFSHHYGLLLIGILFINLTLVKNKSFYKSYTLLILILSTLLIILNLAYVNYINNWIPIEYLLASYTIEHLNIKSIIYYLLIIIILFGPLLFVFLFVSLIVSFQRISEFNIKFLLINFIVLFVSSIVGILLFQANIELLLITVLPLFILVNRYINIFFKNKIIRYFVIISIIYSILLIEIIFLYLYYPITKINKQLNFIEEVVGWRAQSQINNDYLQEKQKLDKKYKTIISFNDQHKYKLAWYSYPTPVYVLYPKKNKKEDFYHWYSAPRTGDNAIVISRIESLDAPLNYDYFEKCNPVSYNKHSIYKDYFNLFLTLDCTNYQSK